MPPTIFYELLALKASEGYFVDPGTSGAEAGRIACITAIYPIHARPKKQNKKKGEGGNEKVEGNKYTALASNIRSKIIIQRNVTGEENELAESTNSIPLSAAPHNLLSIM
jgi:hypothetical protein